MEQINYVPLLPKEPPKGTIGLAIGKGAFEKEFLIYKAAWEYEPLEDRNRKMVEVTCTGCERTFVAEREETECCCQNYAPAPFGFFNEGTMEPVISGMTTKCPICGSMAEVKHVTNVPCGIQQYEWITTLHRIPVEGKKDRLALCDWRIQRTITKQGKSYFDPHLWTAWVVEEKKIVRIAGYRKNFTQPIPIEPEQRKTYCDQYGAVRLAQKITETDLIGTTAENSKLDRYRKAGGERLISYLALWRKRPTVENLVTRGYTKLVDSMIESEMTSYGRRGAIPRLPMIDWKQKRPNRMLHLEKWQERLIGDGLNKHKLEQLTWAEENGLKLDTKEKLLGLLKIGGHQAKMLWENSPDFWRGVRYLQKDRTRTAGNLIDYWNMARKLKLDLDEPQVRWPKDLKKAHDRAVELYNQKECELTAEDFRKRADQLAEFAWYRDGIFIRPCANEAELRREGKELHHCVATYKKKYQEGKTAIFFIRKQEEPDTPWFTLELDEQNLTVRQNRGKYNCARLPEIREFETAWLEWLRGKIKKQKGTSAA